MLDRYQQIGKHWAASAAWTLARVRCWIKLLWCIWGHHSPIKYVTSDSSLLYDGLLARYQLRIITTSRFRGARTLGSQIRDSVWQSSKGRGVGLSGNTVYRLYLVIYKSVTSCDVYGATRMSWSPEMKLLEMLTSSFVINWTISFSTGM